jgi:hypothetical protein
MALKREKMAEQRPRPGSAPEARPVPGHRSVRGLIGFDYCHQRYSRPPKNT